MRMFFNPMLNCVFIYKLQIMDEFKRLYNNSTKNIDVWVGGLLETKEGPGELFATIIEDQFRRIRDGDRFWYRNKQNGYVNRNSEFLSFLFF